MDTAGKNIIFEESGGYNRSGLKIKLPLVKQGQRPHLVPGIAASSLWCTKCYGWRPVGQEVRNSYSTLSREWEILRALRPCKCGYTKASVALYEAESIDYEPTEAEITAEITGALGSGGPRGLNQTAYEAEGSSSTWYSAKFSDGDIELTLVALVPDDEEDIPAYIWEMGESAEGDYVDYEGGDDWSYVHDSLSVHRDIKEAEYTRISGDDMEDYLTDMGFEELPRVPRRERIYQKLYGRGPDGAELFTRVYTSIVDGAVSGARDVGRDAIRVVPIYIHPDLGRVRPGQEPTRPSRPGLEEEPGRSHPDVRGLGSRTRPRFQWQTHASSGRTAEPDSTSGVRSIIPRTWRLGRIGAEVDDAVSERGS